MCIITTTLNTAARLYGCHFYYYHCNCHPCRDHNYRKHTDHNNIHYQSRNHYYYGMCPWRGAATTGTLQPQPQRFMLQPRALHVRLHDRV